MAWSLGLFDFVHIHVTLSTCPSDASSSAGSDFCLLFLLTTPFLGIAIQYVD